MNATWKPSFVTDTATVAVFDLECLKGKLEEDPDWWCTAAAAIEAINDGHAAFVGLGDDGPYEVILSAQPLPRVDLAFSLSCPSGYLFIGAGEETTSDGMEPEGDRGGGFVSLAAGPHRFTMCRQGRQLSLHIELSDRGSNSFQTAPTLRYGRSEQACESCCETLCRLKESGQSER